jgi:hypothetical protein
MQHVCAACSYVQHGRSVYLCSMDIQHGNAWSCMDMQHGDTWPCSMYRQHVHATCRCSTYVHAEWICAMLMHHVHCTMSIAQWSCCTLMQHWLVAWTCSICSCVASTCSMDIQHGHEHAEWTCTLMLHGHAGPCCMGLQISLIFNTDSKKCKLN